MQNKKFVATAFTISLLWLCANVVLLAQPKADVFFRSGQYSAAAKLYEKELLKKENTYIKSKLAFCYRMSNQLEKAFVLYSDLSSKEQAKPDIFFYLAEGYVQKEKYDSAAIWFSRYLKAEPKDMLNAGTALKNLDEIKQIIPYFPDVVLLPFDKNSAEDDNSPFFIKNRLYFSSDRDPGFRFLKEKSNVTGRDYLNIYECEMLGDSISGPIVFCGGKINQQNYNSGSFSCTRDGKYAYFGQNSRNPSKNGAYLIKIYRVEADGNNWKNPVMLPFCNDDMNYMHPSISADGTELFFVSGKPNGKSRTDICHTTLNQDGTWRAVQELGPVINTSFSEGFPFISQDGKLFFASKGHPGYGGFDLFVSSRDRSGNWSKPLNLGKPINSAFDDISLTLLDGRNAGAFSSSRDGGDDDIYFFRHRDSSKIFNINKRTAAESNTRGEISAESKKMSIDAANHIEIGSSQIDYCSLFHYCTFSRLVDKLGNDADSTILSENWILDKIRFEDDKLSKDSLTIMQLDSVVAVLKKYPFKVEIKVHDYSSSSEKVNKILSKKRSYIIAKYLRSEGVEISRVTTRGLGSTQPVCSDKACEIFGKKAGEINERVELQITRLNFP